MAAMPLTTDDIVAAIQSSLSDDLLSSKWRRLVMAEDGRVALSGHCAVAAEALYDLLGGAAAGYTPYVCSYHEKDGRDVYAPAPDGYERLTHWWVRAPHNATRGGGAVIDPTAAQYPYPFPYEHGQATGFMSPQPPSQRARVVIARVEALLGGKNVAAFRKSNIDAYMRAGGVAVLGKADQRRQHELGLKAAKR